MTRQIVVLSGRVASGKTRLGVDLVATFGAIRIKTHGLIETQYPGLAGRRELQAAGDRLDRRTGGRWVADALVRELDSFPDDGVVIVDSARRITQVDAIRAALGSALLTSI